MKRFIAFFCLFIASVYSDDLSKDVSSSFVIVTGASGELGGAIARKLADKNNLILVGRNVQKLEILQNELKTHFPFSYQICSIDYCDSSSILEFENNLANGGGSISGLVLITPRPQFSNDLLGSEESWINLFQSTFIGPSEVLKKVLPYAGPFTKIVVVAGITSVELLPEYGQSCVIRRMWTTYAKALSHQLGPKGICVNTVSPGVVLTDFHVKRIERNARENLIDYESQMKQEVAKIPLRRHALPEEVAKAVNFLLSRDSDFINGVNLVIDGGVTLSY